MAVGGVSSCLSSLCGVDMSLGRHVGERESQESHEGVSSPPKNQELESPEVKLRGESPEEECDLRVTLSWPRAEVSWF